MNEGFIESYSGSGKSKSGEHNKLNRNRRGFYRDKMAVLIS